MCEHESVTWCRQKKVGRGPSDDNGSAKAIYGFRPAMVAFQLFFVLGVSFSSFNFKITGRSVSPTGKAGGGGVIGKLFTRMGNEG